MRPYSMDLRYAIIRLVKKGELTLKKIAELFGVSCRCVQMLARRWRQTGRISPKQPGRSSYQGKIPREKLKHYITQNPDATLAEIRDGCGLNVSLAAICNALKRLGFSRKKKVLHASERDRPDVKAKRSDWTRETSTISPQRFVFVDQTGISTQMHRDYGRAPVGERVIGAIPEKHYLSSTLMGALRLNGTFESLVYHGGTDISAVLAFVESQLAPMLKAGDIVVWDNLKAHHSTAVVNAIERTGAQVLNLPPYSPDLNPIEEFWSKVKAGLRGIAARSQEALLNGLNKALETVSILDIKHWFAHAGYAQTSG